MALPQATAPKVNPPLAENVGTQRIKGDVLFCGMTNPATVLAQSNCQMQIHEAFKALSTSSPSAMRCGGGRSARAMRETLPPSIRFPTCVLFTNRRSCKPWFGLVYSEDNLSNLLSREKFQLLKQLRSTGRVLDRPTMATFGCDKVDVPGLTMGLA